MQALIILLSISILIIFHELAHLVVAKKYNLYVPEFSVGFGPKFFSFKKKETTYNFKIFLLGGFVSIASTKLEEFNHIPKERKIENLKGYQKSILAFAGPFSNVILTFVLSMLFFGLSKNYSLIDTFLITLKNIFRWFTIMNNFFIKLFTFGASLDSIGGPISIIKQGSLTLVNKPNEFLNWLSFISFNLAYANMLPIPPFDGFKFWEGIYNQFSKKEITGKAEKIMYFFSYGLILFVLFISLRDIWNIFSF